MNLTEKSGFFPEYYQNIRGIVGVSGLKKFTYLDNDIDRVDYLQNQKCVRDNDLKIERTFVGKSEQQSQEFKEKGNVAFKTNRYIEALALYGRALFAAPAENKRHIAILYANRSAALFYLQNFKEALLDIKRSMDAGYPKDMLYKIWERKAQIHLAQKDYPNSIAAFQKTVSSLDDSGLALEKRQKIERDAMVMIKMLEKDGTMLKLAKAPKKKTQTDSVDQEFISDVVSVEYTPEEGRFVKAKKNVEVGDQILVEKPNVCALLDKYCQSHCQNCFRRTVTAMPCLNCCDVVFCSEKCAAEATYHKYECGILSTLWKSGASVNCHLALRIIASKPLDYFLKIKYEIDQNLDFDQLKKLPTNDYRRICNLVRHERKRNPSEFFQYSLMARFLSKLLQANGYFGATASKGDISFITSLILRNLQFLQFNTHEVSELHQPTTATSTAKTVFIGGGVYPTLALFNHSCDPGIVRYYRGTKIYVNAVKNIDAGLQISENYGPLYTQEMREDRQIKLSDLYWFDCRCQPCLKNWPKFEDMTNNLIRFRCDADIKCDNVIEVPPDVNEFMIKCRKCGQLTNILKGLKVMQDTEQITKVAQRLFDAGDFKKALEKYLDLLKIMTKVLAPPFSDFVLVQQSIRDCYINMGNAYPLN